MIISLGSCGYIGSHVSNYLYQKHISSNNQCVIGYDDLSTGNYNSFIGEQIIGDILNESQLTATLKCYKPKAVLHFAAKSIVSEGESNPELYFINNVEGTRTVITSCLKAGVRKIIFASTAAVYKDSNEALSENSSTIPLSVYGKTKLAAEDLIINSGLDYVIFRFFNAAGAALDGSNGENHKPETHLIPNLLKKQIPTIYGSNFNTKDGFAVRDYVHVLDIARAFELALEYDQNDIFNLGSGIGYSVKEILDLLAIDKYIISERREGDPSSLICNTEKAKQKLKWHPKYSLKDILETAKKWHEGKCGI